MEYASRAIGNAALTTGIVGAAGTLLGGAGGLMNLFGGGVRQPADPGDRAVTRYEMGLWQQINAEKTENAVLRGQKYTDAAIAGVQAEIGQQAVWNATQTGLINCLKGQVAQLYSMTELTIPNARINPGWGPTTVEPTPVTAAASGT